MWRCRRKPEWTSEVQQQSSGADVMLRCIFLNSFVDFTPLPRIAAWQCTYNFG